MRTNPAHVSHHEHLTLTSGWRREWIFAVGALAACLLLDLALLGFGVDVVDEGYFAEQAARVLRGEVPYRDFESLYTPGLTYLHAAVFAALGGPYIIGLRIVALAGRAALGLALYALARPLAPPRWAIVPALFVLVGIDFAPVFWWPHPGWLSAAASVFAVLLVGSLPTRSPASRARYLFLVGLLGAVVFVLKQNAGVFLGMSVVLCLILQGTDTPPKAVSRGLRATQILFLVITLASLWVLMRPHLDGVLFIYLIAPTIAIGLLLMSGPVSRSGQPLRARGADLLPLSAGFVLVTATWLLLLAGRLNGEFGRLRGFVGAVEQSALFYPLHLPSKSLAMVVLAVAVVAVAAVCLGRPGSRATLGAVGAAVLLVLASFPLRGHPLHTTLIARPWLVADGIPALLPAIAFWAGLLISARSGVDTAAAWRFRWYVTAGAFTFLTEYPIVDVPHLAWSAGVLLAVGAILAGRLQAWVTAQWHLTPRRDKALFAALLVVPVVAALPVLVDYRLAYFLREEPIIGQPAVRRTLVPLREVTFAQGLWATPDVRDELLSVVGAIQERTAPGEPIFVYPASPLLYILADRPNPTRLEHIYPGTVPRQELLDLVSTLERTQVRTVLISSYSLLTAGSSDDVAVINTYLDTNFREVWGFGPYRILQRRIG
jgi:hypothetical protein